MQKQAMGVPVSDEQRKKMALEKIYLLQDIENTMPNVKKKELQQILTDSGIVELFNKMGAEATLKLPKIYMPSKNNLVDIDGKTYYLVHISEPGSQGRGKNKIDVPGEIICIEPETGQISKFDYAQNVDKIKRPASIKQEVITNINKEIKQWNERVDKIQNALGLTTLPLQIKWAEDKVDERLESLNSMIGATQAKLINPRQTDNYDQYISELKEGIASGQFSLKDTFDTLLFIYQTDVDGLIKGIESNTINVPENIKNGVLAIAYQENKNIGEKKQKELTEEQAKEQRMQEGLTEEEMPDVKKLEPVTDIPFSPYEKATAYRSPVTWKQQQHQMVKRMETDRDELMEVKASLAKLRECIGSMEKGQRTKEFISTPEGQELLEELKGFLKNSVTFVTRYKGDIITPEGTINPKLFGSTGTPGNAFIAVFLRRIYAIVNQAIKELEMTPVMASIKTKTLIQKLAEALWGLTFEKRFSLR